MRKVNEIKPDEDFGRDSLIGRQALGAMKEGAFLMNTSRGTRRGFGRSAVDDGGGQAGGAALDVYPEEPPDLGHPLFQHPHIIGMPRASFYSEESVENFQRMSAGHAFQCLTDETPENIVNPQYADAPPRKILTGGGPLLEFPR